MEIVFDITPIQNFLSQNPETIFWQFFIYGGWMILGALFLVGFLEIWLMYVRGKWAENLNFTLLAIDIPRGNEQTPKAVENMFTYLSGAHGSINFLEKWFEGKFQVSFSYEIVSIEGYTQFIIRTPVQFRNLIESSVYSQYPDAEITEVEDYTQTVPHKYPDEEYDVWGTEFVLAKNKMYPIKTYKEFEHNIGRPETQFKDPMASLMDLYNSLGPGEQMWWQLIVIPIGFDWMDEGEEQVDEILNRNTPKSGKILKYIEAFGDFILSLISLKGEEDEQKEVSKELSMMELTPKQKKRIEAIHEKTSKLAFEFKIRAVYVARKEVMNKAKVANGLVGYMKQFAALDLNNLKPDVTHTMTKADYFNQESRVTRKKNNIINNYISRSDSEGLFPGLLNIEEFATLWHFPIEAVVKGPLIQKAPGRKAEAPSSLPLGESPFAAERGQDYSWELESESSEKEEGEATASKEDEKEEEKAEDIPPSNLPFVN